jgi:hypothetical protein
VQSLAQKADTHYIEEENYGLARTKCR